MGGRGGGAEGSIHCAARRFPLALPPLDEGFLTCGATRDHEIIDSERPPTSRRVQTMFAAVNECRFNSSASWAARRTSRLAALLKNFHLVELDGVASAERSRMASFA